MTSLRLALLLPLLAKPAAAITILPMVKDKGALLPDRGEWQGFAAGSKDGLGGGGAGVFGVELRGGDNAGRAQWELGVGRATSQRDFVAAQWHWGCAASNANGCGTIFTWKLDWRPDQLIFSISDGRTATLLSQPAGFTGNTLKFFAKGDAEWRLATVDGMALAATIHGQVGKDLADTLFVWSPKRFGLDGVVAEGQLRMKGGGNSARGLTISQGEFTGAVPEPRQWALFITGFGLVGLALRRRVLQRATL
ncbi:MAG: PEPxxWA-CTERM sorting domain-containing protein [Sphingomonadales bacterium]|jgi:hypothetical protein